MRNTFKPSGLALVLLSLAVVSSAVAQQAPVIRTQPASQTVEAGADVRFEVNANGHRPISYLWRFNGIALPTATDSALTLSNVQCLDAGTYSVVVSNSVGSVTSEGALLTVLDPSIRSLGVSGDEVEGGQRIDFHASVDGTPPFQFEWAFPGFITNTTTSILTRIYGPFDRWEGQVTVTVRNSCGSDSDTLYFSNLTAPIALSRGVPLSRTGTSGSGAAPPCPAYVTSCGSFGGTARWFKMESEVGGAAAISTEGSGYDTVLGVFTGSVFFPCDMVLLACNNDINATNKQSRVRFRAAASIPYWLVVAGSNVGTLRLTYGLEPSIDLYRILPNGSFELQSTNVPPYSYRLLGSTDLQTWQTLFSTNLPTVGDLYFVDPIAPGFRHRFYRFESGP